MDLRSASIDYVARLYDSFIDAQETVARAQQGQSVAHDDDIAVQRSGGGIVV